MLVCHLFKTVVTTGTVKKRKKKKSTSFGQPTRLRSMRLHHILKLDDKL